MQYLDTISKTTEWSLFVFEIVSKYCISDSFVELLLNQFAKIQKNTESRW